MSSPLHRLTVLAFCVLLLTLAPVTAALAEESFAAYPPLPTGYSSIKVYDRNGRFAGRVLPDGRHWVTLDRIPTFLQSAVVAIEDSRFYEHSGVDLRGIARALVKNVAKGKLAEGGSTITQQLVKNKYLSAEKTIDRKVQEGLLALEYEKKYTKQQILEMYFNEIYFGNGAWGIAQAARLYYDKSPEELSDAECAVLAGVPKNPARYNPLGPPAEVEQRRNTVLRRMAELSLITARREEQLRAQRLEPVRPGPVPQYLAHVRRKLVEWYGPRILERGGLSITAAVDIDLQQRAERFLREGVQKLSPDLQGALLCLDPHTGDVLAFAGSVDFQQSSYNRAFFAQRQPGSTIKPLIYAAALEAGVTASSRWDDEPVPYPRGNGQSWTPRNYGGEVYGTLTIREALARSNNVITVKLLDAIGVPFFLDAATRMGLSLRTPNDLSLALGTDEVTLLDLTLAYSALANGGLRPAPRTIIKTDDIYRDTSMAVPPAVTPVLSPEAAYITTRMLQDVMTYGTASSLRGFARERPAAGKTGTTDDYRDAWFIGYTPQLITGVWLGHDQPKPGGRGFTGGAVAVPIWERFMRTALAAAPPLDFPQPETVVAAFIDPATGSLATAECPGQQQEFYIVGTQPMTPCPDHSAAAGEFPPTDLPDREAPTSPLPAEEAP